MKKNKYIRCTKGLWDNTIPDIKFDNSGISNYYKRFLLFEKEFPTGNIGKEKWGKILKEIKQKGKNSKYDCIIGLSGGVDSCYLLHLAVNVWGLRPLAFNLDNGWNSKIAVKNIKLMTDALNVDLETYVINYNEVKSVLKSFMYASLPWVDGATDWAIKSSILQTASKENIKSILVGTDFRSEGKQPEEWTHIDSKLFNYVTKKFGNIKLKTYPNISTFKQLYLGLIKRIKKYQPFYFIDYNKSEAKNFLIENYNWEDYGGHHHENLFTKFIISYWLKKKFNIDKRIITYSAQVFSGNLNRDKAIKLLKSPPYENSRMELDLETVLNKLDLDKNEFTKIWNQKNKSFKDYPSYYEFINKNKNFLSKYYFLFMATKPKMLISDE